MTAQPRSNRDEQSEIDEIETWFREQGRELRLTARIDGTGGWNAEYPLYDQPGKPPFAWAQTRLEAARFAKQALNDESVPR
jgi:hypothetical protein